MISSLLDCFTNFVLASPYYHIPQLLELPLCLLVLFLWRNLTGTVLVKISFSRLYLLSSHFPQSEAALGHNSRLYEAPYFSSAFPANFVFWTTHLFLRSTFPPQEIGGAKILVPTALYKTHYIAASSSNHKFGFQILKMFILILRLDLSSFQFGVESVHQRVLHCLPEFTSFTQSYVSYI